MEGVRRKRKGNNACSNNESRTHPLTMKVETETIESEGYSIDKEKQSVDNRRGYAGCLLSACSQPAKASPLWILGPVSSMAYPSSASSSSLFLVSLAAKHSMVARFRALLSEMAMRAGGWWRLQLASMK